jgi:DNA polymerase elongation subunit (family B)
MSYISAMSNKQNVYIWERNNPKKRDFKVVTGIFELYIKDPKGKYKSVYGDSLSKYVFKNPFEMRDAKNQLSNRGIELFESDIIPELKVLSEKYYNVKAPKLNYTMWDIEVDYDPLLGFSDTKTDNPSAPINAVAIYHEWNNKSIVIAVPPKNWDNSNKLEELAKDTKTDIRLVKNEKELLKQLVIEFENSDCISGWNSDTFDTPYLAKRLESQLGKSWFNKLSFPEARSPRYGTLEMYGKEHTTIQLFGRISLDYMLLFKKFEMSQRPSYSLESISNELLPDLPKLEYDGSLHTLYNNDFEHFIRYNIRDTEVLAGFEKKLGYLELANELYHLGTGLAPHIMGTVKLADLSIINYCHYTMDRKVPDRNENKEDGQIAGAMVLTPRKGLHDYIGSVDITSLYPSAIRCVNASPEVMVGQLSGILDDDDRAIHSAWKLVYDNDNEHLIELVYDKNNSYGKGEESKTGKEWKEIFLKNKWAISGFGTIFDQNEPGMIPSVLSEWFDMRKQFKRDMIKAKDKLVGMDKRTKEFASIKQDSEFFDRKQYVYKILLNSLYGCLTNYYFRFFSLEMGQTTTATGRCILDHMCSQIALTLDGNYDSSSESITYGDTDSCYFRTNAEYNSDKLSEEQKNVRAIKIADKVGEIADSSFPKYCKDAFLVQPDYEDIIKCDREVVAKRGIFVSKKRYVLKLVDLDGYRCNKLKAMGLEMKKTTTPKHIQKFLAETIDMILEAKSWDDINTFIVDYRVKLNTMDVMSIGLPKGVNGVEKYTKEYTDFVDGRIPKPRIPGHVSASIHYNLCLEKYNDTESESISTGNKIRVFYIKNKHPHFKSIAIPTDIRKVPDWFYDNFEIDMDKHEDRLIDKNLIKIFEVLGMDVPDQQSQFNNTLMDF